MDLSADRMSLSLRGPGGKACANCARVKCKCITRIDGNICERCHRLNKSCVPSSPPKRRGPKRNNASRSTPTTARLEKKLDDLMSLMRVQQTPASSSHGSTGLAESDDGDNHGNDTSPTSTDDPLTCIQTDAYIDEPSAEEAETCLLRFREEMIPLCPYVYIPPELKSVALRQQYPFLWLNIMSVANSSTKKRYSLGRQARSIIVHKIVAGGVRSVDMLLGVLTYLTWVHRFPMDKLFASMASQITVSLIHDIGLHTAPPEQPSKIGQVIQYKVCSYLPQVRKERTMEDRRALLGAYVVTSMTCHAFRSADGLLWSPYLDECLDYVAQNSVELQDCVLVAYVKLQLMINQLRFTYRGGSSAEVPVVYLDALRLQLDSIVTPVGRLSTGFENNSMMTRLHHFTMLVIHESLLIKPPSPHNPDPKQFQIYQHVVDSIRCWLDLYFSIQPDHLLNLPCENYNQLYYIMIFIYRMSTFRVPSWTSLVAEAAVELVPTLDKVIQKFEQAEAAASLRAPGSGADESLLFGIQKFSALRTICQSELAPLPDGEDNLASLQEDPMMGEGGPDLTAFLLDSAFLPAMPGIFDNVTW